MTGLYHLIDDPQSLGVFGDGVPAEIRMLNVRFLVEFEKLEFIVAQAKELSPAVAFEAKPAMLTEYPFSVSGNIGPLSDIKASQASQQS